MKQILTALNIQAENDEEAGALFHEKSKTRSNNEFNR